MLCHGEVRLAEYSRKDCGRRNAGGCLPQSEYNSASRPWRRRSMLDGRIRLVDRRPAGRMFSLCQRHRLDGERRYDEPTVARRAAHEIQTQAVATFVARPDGLGPAREPHSQRPVPPPTDLAQQPPPVHPAAWVLRFVRDVTDPGQHRDDACAGLHEDLASGEHRQLRRGNQAFRSC